MKKIYILLMLIFFITTGCENKEEQEKNEYIAMKSHLLNETNYSNEELPLDITVSIDRINEEEINYKVLLSNPKENMHQIKVLVVHNYYNEELFPSIGLFDKPQELKVEEEPNKLELSDAIKTTKNISKLALQLKIKIEYLDDEGKKKDIYYKTT